MDKELREKFLRQKQNLPFELKIKLSLSKIEQWMTEWENIWLQEKEFKRKGFYVAFSGGLDSTVLLDLVRKVDSSIPAVFNDTGLEYPEIREFVKSKDNVIFLKPKINFSQVITQYGYPIISKEVSAKINEIQRYIINHKVKELPSYWQENNLLNTRLFGKNNNGKTGKLSKCYRHLITAPFKISDQCCDKLKTGPAKTFERDTGFKPFVGTRYTDSSLRKSSYLQNGCNAFALERPVSRPLSFWSRSDIHTYIHTYKLDISEIYNKGYNHTGCMFCMFGLKYENPDKFELMSKTHPQLYDYCMTKLGLKEVLEYIAHNKGKEIKDNGQTRLF